MRRSGAGAPEVVTTADHQFVTPDVSLSTSSISEGNDCFQRQREVIPKVL